MSTATLPSETETTKPAANTKRRGTRFAIVGVVLVVAVIAVVQFTGWLGSFESTDDAQVDGHINAISARVSGYVAQVNVEENQFVKAGTVLAQIDPRDYQVAVNKAKADLADAQATAKASQADVPITAATTADTLANTRAGEVDAQRGISAAQRSLEAATARVAAARAKLQQEQANNDKAAADEQRYKQLVQKDEISKQQYDAAVASSRAAQASVASAQASVSEAEQNVDMLRAQLGQNQARLSQAQAQVSTALTGPQQLTASRARFESSSAKVQEQQAALDQAQLNLGYTTIVAPVSGLVGRKSVEVGQNVTVGQQLLSIVPTDDIWITANFKETQLRKMHAGQRVKVHVDGYARDYDGKVESISPAAGARFSLLPPENATGNYVKVVQRIPVRIRLDQGQDPDHLLRPGMSVVPKVYTN